MADKQISVLLVDDDETTCDLFRHVMEHHGWPLVVYRDAESALNHLEKSMPEILVTDIFLPGRDGFQLMQDLERLGLRDRMIVVATTAYHTRDTAAEVASRGFDGYMPKPLGTGTLVEYLAGVYAANATG